MSGPVEFWQRVNGILLEALELDPGKRGAYLTSACRDDPVLRREVETMLALDSELVDWADRPAVDLLGTSPAADTPPGIAGFRIERELGRGGIGAVYLAEREGGGPPGRVAVKVLKRGMATEEILRRFRTERQILAQLRHPHIVRYRDAGISADDRPFLIMEHVEGEPIDRYCDGRSLATVERIELFLKVCSAVQFAHQSLVIHRDLKPSNILVTADAEPKLLDFGIAKLLTPDTADPTTVAGRRLMTPEYASPEQVEGHAMTTASDVYSLGVVLYEILTGHRPYDVSSDPDADFRHVVLHAEPEPPSVAVARVVLHRRPDGELVEITPESVSRVRDGDLRRLRRRLAGDVDNIVLKALRKSPEERYSSVELLAQDIRRHLVGEPVQALTGGFSYRLGKAVRRYKKAIAFALVFLLSVAGFMIGQELQQRRIAEERDRARQVSSFLTDLFAVPPNTDQPLSARQLLDFGAQKLEREPPSGPDLHSDLLLAIGSGYSELGLFETALPFLEDALELRRQLYGQVHPAVAEGLFELAALEVGRGRYDRAEEVYRECLAIRRLLLERGDPELENTLSAVAAVRMDKGDYSGAESLFVEALTELQRAGKAETKSVAAIRGNLAIIAYRRGDYERAESLYREALSTSRRLLGEDHSQVSAEKLNLATCLRAQGDLETAEKLYLEVLATWREQNRGAHPIFCVVYNHLAIVALLRGDLVSAGELMDRVQEMSGQLFDEEHPERAHFQLSRVRLLLARGEAAKAEEEAREALDILRRRLPETHWQVSYARSLVGAGLARQGRYAEAEAPLTESYRHLVAQTSERAWPTRDALDYVIELYEAWDRPRQAAEFRRRRVE